MKKRAGFVEVTLDGLRVEDERSFAHVPTYAALRDVLRRARYRFRVLPASRSATWDRALLLNLTFWGATDEGDVLVARDVPADVVAHVAWHHLAARALAAVGKRGARPHVEALFVGEAIASAFDLYMVGRLLGRAPRSSFLASQVPAMAEVAQRAGLSERAFTSMLAEVARAPERAFADLYELLVDATRALFAAEGPEEALAALTALEGRRFAPLLHRFELSNWVLYARAYGDPRPSKTARAVDRALRAADDPVAWLDAAWVAPALGRGARLAAAAPRSARRS